MEDMIIKHNESITKGSDEYINYGYIFFGGRTEATEIKEKKVIGYIKIFD
jgi:hypothetical protein